MFRMHFAHLSKLLSTRRRFLKVLGFICALLLLFASVNVSLGAPDDSFAEHNKHLPWTRDEIPDPANPTGSYFILRSGYNEFEHITPNTRYLLNFSKRDIKTFERDQAGTKGQSVRVIGDGTVVSAVRSGYNESWGRHVKVSHGGGYETRYDHLGSVSVNVGDNLTAGTEVGKVGDTGLSAGYHIQVSLYKNGVLVPMETDKNVIGLDINTGESPITSFFGKTWHFFLSENVDGLPEFFSITSAKATSCSTVKIIWEDNPKAEFYEVYRNDVFKKRVSGNVTEFFDQGLTGATVYRYQVKAVNIWGSTNSNKRILKTPACPPVLPAAPAAPVLNTAVSPKCSEVNLAWTNVANEKGYKIYRNNALIREVSADTVKFTDTTMLDGAAHDYFIRAYNEGGESSKSNSKKVSVEKCLLPPVVIPPNDPSMGGEYLGEGSFGENDRAGLMDDPVNAHSGNFYAKYEDLAVDSFGIPVEITRAYNSQDPRTGAFGEGWQFGYDIKFIATGGSRYAVKLADGSADYFDKQGDNFVPVFANTVASLRLDGETIVYTKPDGTRFLFDPYGKLKKIEDRNGNFMVFTYDADAFLDYFTDTAGRTYDVIYKDGRIQQIKDPAGRTVTYTYNVDNRLETAKTPGGKTWKYSYNAEGPANGAGKLEKITNPRGLTEAQLKYDPQDRAVQITHADTGVVKFQYNANATTQTDERGGTLVFEHDQKGRLIKLTDQLGKIETYAYDAIDRIKIYTDRNGRITQFTYDNKGNLTHLKKSNGYEQTIIYNSFSQPLAITDFTGTVKMEYDAKGNLIKQRDQAGNETIVTNNNRGQVTSIKNPLGNTSSFNYDGQGNTSSITNPAGKLTQFGYDGISRRTGVKDALAAEAVFGYSGDSETTQLKDPKGKNLTYEYDGKGNVIKITNEAGHSTSFTYTPTGRLAQRTDFEGNTWKFEYDLDDQLILERDPRGNETKHSYDTAGRRIKTVLPEGGVTQFAYDGNDNITEIIDPRGHKTFLEYTTTNALKKITNHLGNTATFERDALDRVTKIKDWNGNIRQFEYDNLSRVRKETTVRGGTILYRYDDVSNLVEMTDPLGRSTKYTYNNLNQRISLQDAEGGVTKYEYDDVGNQIKIIDPNGNKTAYEYDKNNNVVKITDGEGNAATITYDARNLTEKITDGNEHLQHFTYDKNSRLKRRVDARGNNFNYSYDASGNLISTTDEVGATTTFAYDGDNRFITQKTPLGHLTSFEYDASGNIIKITDPRNFATQYVYDELNRLIESKDALGGVVKMAYDPNGNLVVQTDQNNHSTGFDYAPDNQITKLVNAKGDSASRTYDLAGNLKERTDFRGNSARLEYDKLNRLVRAADPLNHATTYAYDGLGNVTKKIDAAGAVTSYEYDKANRLVKIARPEQVVEQFVYDAASNVIERIDGENGTTRFSYDPNNNLIAEKSPMGFETKYVYSAHNLRTEVIDANNHKTRSTYDLDRNLKTITDPRGQSESFFYDANDNLIRENDKRNFDSKYTYDPLNRRNSFADQKGFTEKYAYDSVGNLKSKANRRNFNTGYFYDELNRLTSLTDAKGNKEFYTYDKDGNLIETKDRDGNVTTHTYNAVSNLVKSVDALNGVSTFTYDPMQRLTASTNPNNQKDQYIYDELSRLTKEINAMNGETSYTYNKRSEQIAVKNPRGFDTLMAYDADGRLTKRTDPMKFTEVFELDSVGNVLKSTDKRGNATRFEYDPNDQLAKEIDALNFVKAYTYDPNGNLTVMKDARGNDWKYTYDPRNDVVAYGMPEGQTEKYEYDANQNKIKQTLPRGNARTFGYDELDLVVSSTDPLGHKTANAYDALERKIKTTDAKNQSTQYGFDPLSRLTSVTDPLKGMMKYEYDPVGNLLKNTDANQHATQYTYDDLNRTVGEKNPLGSVWNYEYDPNSNLTLRRDAQGAKTSYTYDPNDRQTITTYPDASINVARKYDPNANLIEMKDKSGSSTFSYDPRNRLTDQTDGKGNLVRHAYDGNGNRTRITYPNGKALTQQFSPNNWLSESADWQNLKTQFAYDDNHNLVEELYPNNSKVAYSYDDDDRLIKKINAARNEAFETYAYAYDPVHNITRELHKYSTLRERGPVETKENTIDYSYDALSRLTAVSDALDKKSTYSYDPVGNRLKETNNRNFYLIANGKGTFDSNAPETITYQYNAANQLTADSLFNYKYDKNGNRLEKNRKDGVERMAYSYDAENRMTKVEVRGAGKTNAMNYTYDGLNRRVQKESGGSLKSAISSYILMASKKTPPRTGNPGLGNQGNEKDVGNAPDAPAGKNRLPPGQGAKIKPEGPTWYVYDQFSFDPVAEMRHPNKELQLRRAEGHRQGGTGRLLSSELFSPDAPEPGDELQELGRYAYFYSDHRNNITSLLKHDGQSLHSYVYEEYGAFYDVNQSKGNSSNFIDPHNAYTFSGKEFDRETGLMYYGARYLDPWSGTWNNQDILRGSIHFPETMHRYAFVKNNPVNFIDRYGFESESFFYDLFTDDPKEVFENHFIDPYLESYSAAHTFDTSFSTAEIPLKTVTAIFAPPLAPFVENLPPASVNLKNEVDLDFNFTDSGYTFTGSDIFTGGMETAENNYGVGASGDVGIISSDQGLYTGAGGAVNVRKNGKIIVDKGGFAGDTQVLPLFGANSVQDYINKERLVLNQKVIESIRKAKDERIRMRLEYERKLAELAITTEGCVYSSRPLVNSLLFIDTAGEPKSGCELPNDKLEFLYNLSGDVPLYVREVAKQYNVPPELIATVLEMENAPGTWNSFKRFNKRLITFYGNNYFGQADSWDYGLGMSEGLSNTKPSHAEAILKYFQEHYPNDTDQLEMIMWSMENLTSDQASISIVGAGMKRSIEEKFGVGYAGSLSIDSMAEMAARHNTPDAPRDKDNFTQWILRSTTYFENNSGLKNEYNKKLTEEGLVKAEEWKAVQIQNNAVKKQKDFQNDIEYARWLLEQDMAGTKPRRF